MAEYASDDDVATQSSVGGGGGAGGGAGAGAGAGAGGGNEVDEFGEGGVEADVPNTDHGPPAYEDLPSTYVDSLRFSDLCHCLDVVLQKSKPNDKIDALFTDELLDARNKGETLYPLFRLILPQLDRERRSYKIKARKIGELYIDILRLGKTSHDAKRLRDWKDPAKTAYGAAASSSVGDFAGILREVMRARAPNDSHKTIAEVNEILTRLSKAPDGDSRKRCFVHIIDEFSAREQMWLARIILRDLKVGLKHERVLNFYHPDALEAYNASTDLRMLCANRQLLDPRVRVQQDIKLMKMFRPMLCKRRWWRDNQVVMGTGSFYIEEKLDGERMLLHKRGSEFKMYSRNSNDYSDYASVMRTFLTKSIDAEDCILDGEVVVWDSDNEAFVRFGSARTVVAEQMEDPGSKRHLCYMVFDILWCTNRPDFPECKGAITDLPLDRRKTILRAVVKDMHRRIEMVPSTFVCTDNAGRRREIVTNEFQKIVLGRGAEGLCLKKAGSPYQVGERNDRWVKLKPEYFKGGPQDMDFLIVAGYFGEGRRRSGNVSHFLLAVADESSKDENDMPTEFYTFTKVGSGYNRMELQALQNSLNPHWRRVGNKRRPTLPNFLHGWVPGKADDVPDVVIDHPSHGIILKVKAAEIVPTTQFNTNLTFRFPRVESIRRDKPWYDCQTRGGIEELYAMLKDGSLATSGRGMPSTGLAATKKRRTSTRRSRELTMLQAHQGADMNDVTVVSEIFDQHECCVIGASTEDKHHLERLIHAHGGVLTQNPMSTTDFIIAVDQSLKVTNLIKANMVDIVKPEWVQLCIQAKRLLPLEPSHLLHVCPSTADLLSTTFDEFGDHYSRETTKGELFDVFERMKHADASHSGGRGSKRTRTELEAGLDVDELNSLQTPYSLFKAQKIHVMGIRKDFAQADGVSDRQLLESPLPVLMAQLRTYGANIVDDISTTDGLKSVTHIIVDEEKRLQVAELAARLDAAGVKALDVLVTHSWVQACIDAQRVLDTTDGFSPVIHRAVLNRSGSANTSFSSVSGGGGAGAGAGAGAM